MEDVQLVRGCSEDERLANVDVRVLTETCSEDLQPIQAVENMTTYKYEPLPPVEGPRGVWDRSKSTQLSTRLLTIYGGQYEDDIKVDLEVVSLGARTSDRPTYEAMSYVWGSPEMLNTVYVGKEKKKVMITANLDEAIRYMRYPDRPRTMWIDSLCIDQQNIEERGRQVAYMSYIFWGAPRVVIWLGKAADDSDRAMNTLSRVASLTASGGKSGATEGTTELDERQSGEFAPAMHLEDAERRSILALLLRPWFERIWVRQEVHKAGEESLVACGTKTLSWMAVRGALNSLHERWNLTPGLQHSQEYRNRFHAALMFFKGGNFDLKRLRLDLCGTKCTDPRDRVYGLLGILNGPHYLDAVVPEYSKPVSKAYISVILVHMAINKSVDFLITCHKDSREEISVSPADALPTWVPDWAHPDSEPYYTFRSLEIEKQLCPFQCSAKYLGRGVLRVAGVSYGKIIRVLRLDHSTSEALSTSIRLHLPQNAADQHYPGGGNLLNAFGTTLFADTFLDNHYPPISDYFERYFPLRYEESQNAMKRLMDREDVSRHYALFLELVRCNCYNGRFFTTDKGFLGWSPTRTTEGDQVTSILGCQAPMILRPFTMNEDQFEVVGPSYTHGASYGSAFLGPLPSNLRPVWHFNDDNGSPGMNFHDLETGAIHSEDARLENLPVDLTEYREERKKGNPMPLLPISPETWRAHGVDVVNFDLI